VGFLVQECNIFAIRIRWHSSFHIVAGFRPQRYNSRLRRFRPARSFSIVSADDFEHSGVRTCKFDVLGAQDGAPAPGQTRSWCGVAFWLGSAASPGPDGEGLEQALPPGTEGSGPVSHALFRSPPGEGPVPRIGVTQHRRVPKAGK
jgi:hypothetical protein